MTLFKFKWAKVHEKDTGLNYTLVKVYIGEDPATYQWCGELRLQFEEWVEMQKIIGSREDVEFVEFTPTNLEIEKRTTT